MRIKNIKLKIEKRWWRQRVKNVYHLFESIYYTYKYGFPARKLTVIGVTGTDGKTTTSTLIYELLIKAGYKAGLISTVGARYSEISSTEKTIDTGLHTTNPDAKELQPIIKRMADEGVTHLVLEVTAHGIDQHRIWGTNISIGVLTNITREHLDDFVNMDRYAKVKLKMFLQKSIRYAVLNEDDTSFSKFQSSITKYQINHKIQIIKYKKTNIKGVSEALSGDYNLYNIAAATSVAQILKIPDTVIKQVVSEFKGVAGRREEVKVGQRFRVFVDFAHTPNALEQLLRSMRTLKSRNAQLILMFGCTGERDAGKRPMMGRVAVDLADRVIITSDDTRGESQDEIYRQIAAGIPASMINKVSKENDRAKALKMAVEMAKPGDIVVLAGKGHEKTILIGNKEVPWNDAEEAGKLLH